MQRPPVKILPPPTEEESLASAIRKISGGMEKLTRSGLNYKAVVVLLHDACKISKRDIENVLDNLAELAKKYTTEKP